MSLSALLSMALAVVLTDNYVLTRLLGVQSTLDASQAVRRAARTGLTVTAVMGVSALITWPVNTLILAPLRVEVLRTAVFVPLIAGLLCLSDWALTKAVPKRYAALGIELPRLITNTAVLGAALLGAQSGYGLIETVIYHVLAGLGLTLVGVLLAGLRTRPEASDHPKSFDGAPIALVTAGLLAMTFLGFAGLQIW